MAESDVEAKTLPEPQTTDTPEVAPESEHQTERETAETGEEKLKHLQFVHSAWQTAVLGALRAYGYAKENSGPLKGHVEKLEGTVKTVVSPVYNKYQGVPVDVLKFVDRKVGESVNRWDGRVPPVVKDVSTRAFLAAQKAPDTARAVATEVRSAGVVGSAKNVITKYQPAAKELYTKYEPVAGEHAASAWRTLHKLPLFPHVAKVVVPTAGHFAGRYNLIVQQTAEKGYKVSSYLPTIPTEKISKILQAGEAPVA